MPQPQPRIVRVWLAAVGQVGLVPVADIEQIAQNLDCSCAAALRPAEPRRAARETGRADRAAPLRSRSPRGSSCADRRSAARALRVAIGEAAPHCVQNFVVSRQMVCPPPAAAPLRARGESSRRRALRRRPCGPQLSVSRTMLRVKKGPCAPLRFSSMRSCPATGITRMLATSGVDPYGWLTLSSSMARSVRAA